MHHMVATAMLADSYDFGCRPRAGRRGPGAPGQPATQSGRRHLWQLHGRARWPHAVR